MNPIEANSRYTVMYVGSYTHKREVGITVYRLDLDTGDTSVLQQLTDIKNASFLTTDPVKNRLYAVSEVQETAGTVGGEVVCYELDVDSGSLKPLGRQLTHGKDPCYVSLSNRSEPALLLVTNYSSGNVSVFPLSPSGDIEPASQIVVHEDPSQVTERQLEAHPHSIVVQDEGPFVVVSDLGMDKLVIYQPDTEQPHLIRHSETEAARGAGPRHFVFHPSQPYAYGINELNNTVTAFAYHAEAGRLTPIQTVDTLPADFKGESTSADLHLDPSGSFLYGSNRGHNSVVVYRIHPESGMLTYVEHCSTRGKTPRNFAIAPGGKLLLVANQDSDTIEIFHRETSTGKLEHSGKSITVSEPVCLHMI
jgi:6-phosphogluconolactonase